MMMKKKVIIASVRMPLTHQFFHLGRREGKMLEKVKTKLFAHHRRSGNPKFPSGAAERS